MIEYVIFNKDLGLFFSDFGNGIFSKYVRNAKRFYSYGYACDFFRTYYEKCWFKHFKVVSLNQITKELLYA